MKQILFILIALVTYGKCSPKANDATRQQRYSEFLSFFSDSTYYAVERISGHEILLVSNEVFTEETENQKTTDKAIAAQLYMIDEAGKFTPLGEVRSQGTLYPLAVDDSALYTAGHHYVCKYAISGTPSSLSIAEYADETFDENANVSYTYENRVTNEYAKPMDDLILKGMFNKFEGIRSIVFKPVNSF